MKPMQFIPSLRSARPCAFALSILALCSVFVLHASAGPADAAGKKPAATGKKAAATGKKPAAETAFRSKSKTIMLPGDVPLVLHPVPGGLWFAETETTQAQWAAVMGENSFPSGRRLKTVLDPKLPVGGVRPSDCLLFLRKINSLPGVRPAGFVFDLPSRDEWLAASKAKDGTASETLDAAAWTKENSGGAPHPVGTKHPNAYGLFDMWGNLEEWTKPVAGPGGETLWPHMGGGYSFERKDGRFQPATDPRREFFLMLDEQDFVGLVLDPFGFRVCLRRETEAERESSEKAESKEQEAEANLIRQKKESAAESERMNRSQRFTSRDAWGVMVAAEVVSIAASEETDASRLSEAKALAAAAKDIRARAVAIMKGSGKLPDFDEKDMVSVKNALQYSVRLDPAEALDLLRRADALKDSCEAFFGTKDRPGADFAALLAKAFSRADKLKEALESADFDWDDDIACREAVASLKARIATLSSLPTNGVPEMVLIPFRKNLSKHLSALRDMSAILRKGQPDGIVSDGDFDDLDELVSQAEESFASAREIVSEISDQMPTLGEVIEML